MLIMMMRFSLRFSLRRRRRGKRMLMMMMVVIMMRLMLLHHLFPSDTAHDPTESAEVQSEFRRLFSHSILERIPVVRRQILQMIIVTKMTKKQCSFFCPV